MKLSNNLKKTLNKIIDTGVSSHDALLPFGNSILLYKYDHRSDFVYHHTHPAWYNYRNNFISEFSNIEENYAFPIKITIYQHTEKSFNVPSHKKALLFNLKDSTVILRNKNWMKVLSNLERVHQVKKWKKNLEDNKVMVQEIQEGEVAILGNIVFTNWHGGTNLLVEYA